MCASIEEQGWLLIRWNDWSNMAQRETGRHYKQSERTNNERGKREDIMDSECGLDWGVS